ncbi:COG3904 family protein [Methanococcus vannielii]|jgi:hypothetical protein|nr:hypothetical protein [Methanococcus vannielii]
MTIKKLTGFFVILLVFTGFTVYYSEKISGHVQKSNPATFEVRGSEAIMVGVINEDIVEKVSTLIHDYPKVNKIVLLNVPGSKNSWKTIEAGKIVRKNGLNTHVPKNGYIASGGTVFFCAGINRTVESGAIVGVHSWSNNIIDDASILPKNHPYHKVYLDYFEEMGISDEFYWFMIESAPSFRMHYMTEYELKKYGLITN